MPLRNILLFVVVLIVAATMMHPTFASLLAIAIIAGLLALLQWVAREEGERRARGAID